MEDRDSVGDRAVARQRRRAAAVESILDGTEEAYKYPTRSDEVAAEYGDDPFDLPNETEALASVFDRLSEQLGDREARRALRDEVSRTPVIDED